MKQITRALALAVATTATLGALAGSAHALSLGPAGTTVVGDGRVGNAGSLYYGYTFGGIDVDCEFLAASGTLDGGPNVRLGTIYNRCVAKRGFSGPGGLTGPATVSAPGGHELTLTSVTQRQDGTFFGRGRLTSGISGVTVRIGNCRLTIPSNTDLVSDPRGQVHLQSGGLVALVHPILRNPSLPYRGSEECPAAQRGSHSSGAGLSYWFTRLEGLRITP